jgi:hypothetical protein
VGDTLRSTRPWPAQPAGVGPGLSPRAALQLGLKVDAEALPEESQDAIGSGAVDLDAPATTLALLELDAVVGVTGFFDDQRRLTSMGIQCLVSPTVDDSLARHRTAADGWANRTWTGAVVAFAPDVSVLSSLGVDDGADALRSSESSMPSCSSTARRFDRTGNRPQR